MKLYYVPQTRAFRALWALEELGEPFELVEMTREEKVEAEHRERHPLGKVPVLDDGEGPIYESTGILLHLADSYPGKGLAPAPGTHERALLYQWLFYAMTELEVPLVDVYIQKVHRDPPDEAIIDGSANRFASAIAVIEAELGSREFMLESGFSIADIVLGEMLTFAGHMEQMDGLPNCAAYLGRLKARPAHERASAVGAAA